MSVLCDLTAAGIIERDRNNDVLWTWSYPSIKSDQREFLIAKSCLGSSNPLQVNFVYGQWQDTWYYISITYVEDGDTSLNQLTQFAIVLLCKDFNPEKYGALCKLFGTQYRQTGNASSILERYLSVITHGSCSSDENGKFSVSDYGVKEAYAKCKIKEIIQTFGLETIVIYTAVLLKKRIAIYVPPHSLQTLLDYTRSIPAFAWHRQNWNIVYPHIQLSEEEISSSLEGRSHYVAGFSEAAVEGRDDLYDIFVNVPNSQVTIASHAKESFSMLHKETAKLMVKSAEDDSLSDIDVIKILAKTTEDLLNNLKSLATTEESGGKLSLTLETLKKRKMPPAKENFLFNLAASEGLVKL